ncbi:hypothetical protein Emed_000004 [Eimeria media]
MNRLTLSSQGSQQPSITPVCRSSVSSAALYNTSLRGVKYPTYDGSGSQEKVNDFLNVFAVVKSLNNLFDIDLTTAGPSIFLTTGPLSRLPYAPHYRAALTRLQQLRSTDDLPLDDIEEACVQEDEAEFARASFSRFGPISQKPHQVQRQSQARVDKLAALCGPSISAQVIKTNSLISNPKQLVLEGTVNKHPITFLLDGGADHSIMSKNFAVTHGDVAQQGPYM